MGHLHALWHDALEQQEDGDLTKWSDEMLADSSQFDGDAPQYVSLLQLHGWLDGRLIHDWLDYAGPYLISKYHTNKRAWLVEVWAKHGKEYGKRKQTGSEQEVNGHSREDEMTLDKKKLETPTSTSSPASPEPSKPHPYLAGLILYESDPKLNAIEKKTGEPRIQVLYRAWKAAFPNVDVMAQVKAAHAWELKQDPKNRKTNRPKFLGSWMARNSTDGGVFQRGTVTDDNQKEKREPIADEVRGLLSGLGKTIPK